MKSKFTLLLSGGIFGAIAGAAIAMLLSTCCCHRSCPTDHCVLPPDSTGLTHVDTTKANTFFKAYMLTPQSIDTLKAFSINLAQFNAMKLIMQHDSTVHGFRIYMGKDSSVNVRMVVGFGSPEKVDYIYQTSEENSGPCPDVCDLTSPIMDK